MAVEDPPGVLNTDTTDSKIQRHAHQALAGAAIGAFAGGASAFGVAHGICTDDDFAVAQMDTPGMGVKVGPGLALVTGTVSAEQGPYSVYNDATIDNVSLAEADSTNPRDDLIIVQVRDAEYSGANIDARVTAITGTPASSPSDPSLASHPNALVLARVRVDAGATSITNAKITDLRPRARGSNWNVAWGTLGYAQITSGPSGITTLTDIDGLAVTVDVPAGRRIRIRGRCMITPGSASGRVRLYVREGSSGLQSSPVPAFVTLPLGVDVDVVLTPTVGEHTYKLSAESNSAGTIAVFADSSNPAFILVEDVGPA